MEIARGIFVISGICCNFTGVERYCLRRIIHNMNSISSFISELSSYYWHENDLSNITVALCNNCQEFKNFFLKFFFVDLNIDDVEEIRREVPDEKNTGSRVDIFISMKSEEKPYLIEVKIGDPKQHFGQYDKAYGITPDRLGYIVNYQMNEPGYDVKTWESLYISLNEYVNYLDNEEAKHLINGYLEYLKSVCQIETFNKVMNLTGIYALYEFTTIACNALTFTTDTYNCKVNKQYQPVKNKKILGINVIDFYLDYNDKRRNNIYGWLSLYFNDEEPELYIAIQEKYNKSTHPQLFGNDSLKAGKTYKKPYEDMDEAWKNNCLWFEYKHMNTFNNATTIDEQKEMLNAFVKEVMDFVANH